MTWLDALFGSDPGYMPHGMCYLWSPGMIALQVGSDALIGLAYLSIPLTLLYVVRKRTDIPFNWMIGLFGVFIVACGLTHVMEIWNVWHSDYQLAGGIKLVTALASVPTAILLIRIVPRVLEIPTRRELEAANRRLEDANRELEQFAYAVSHDLRAPLRHIEGYGKALESGLAGRLDEKQSHYLKSMREGSRHMSELIDALLELSRVSREHITHKEVDLSALVQELLKEHQDANPGRGLHYKVQPGMHAVGDPHLIRVVLQNLLNNALKFTAKRDDALIECGMGDKDGAQVFYISDNGVGFDMQYAHRLFSVFQRLHSAQDYEGTGIGLATVQRIVRRHGGRIWAEAVQGAGATFYFTLPGQEA